MRIKSLVDEDFINYKKPSMFIGTTTCTWKCLFEQQLPLDVCQNRLWRDKPVIDIPNDVLIQRYLGNHITSAIVFGGLEPMMQFAELYNFINEFKRHSNDDVVIYTGYTEDELKVELFSLRMFRDIIIKFGRYVPNNEPHFDEVLGVNLASDNQYAVKIS